MDLSLLLEYSLSLIYFTFGDNSFLLVKLDEELPFLSVVK